VLGALFRSVRYERRETELVVLVTPRLVSGMRPDQVPAVPGERWRHPEDLALLFGGDIGAELDPAGGADEPAPQFQGRHGFTPAAAPAPVE
jgi:pilus assembly protein CpaC